MAASGAIEYNISDARKALLCIQDFDISLQNLAMGNNSPLLEQEELRRLYGHSWIGERSVKGVKKKGSGLGTLYHKILDYRFGRT